MCNIYSIAFITSTSFFPFSRIIEILPSSETDNDSESELVIDRRLKFKIQINDPEELNVIEKLGQKLKEKGDRVHRVNELRFN